MNLLIDCRNGRRTNTPQQNGRRKSRWLTTPRTGRQGNDGGGDGPVHPGEHLAEMLAELGRSQRHLAQAMGVPPARVSQIIHGRRGITADTALRLGQALAMTPGFWLNLQHIYDLDLVRGRYGSQRRGVLGGGWISATVGNSPVTLAQTCPPKIYAIPKPSALFALTLIRFRIPVHRRQ